MTELDTDKNATPADPGAIDVERIKVFYGLPTTVPDSTIDALIAAVEALRARITTDGLPCECRFRGVEGAIRQGSETGVLVDPDKPIRECALHAALRVRVADLECEIEQALKWQQFYMNKVEAAEAREVELVEALGDLRDEWCRHHCIPDDPRQGHWDECTQATAVLAATSAQVLERARAVERMNEALERLSDFPPWAGEDFAAFTKWVQGTARGALGKEK